MAEAKDIDISAEDNIQIGSEATRFGNAALGIGVVALLGGLALGGGFSREFIASYVVAFMYVLSIALGALWFVTIQHLTNAKWSVVVRRVAEVLASNFLLVVILAAVVIIPMATGKANGIYEWLDHDKVHASHLLHQKAGYLNLGFFLARCAVYFGFWAFLSSYFLKRSMAQDSSGDAKINQTLYAVSAPSMVAFALTLTFCSIDFMMSIDATWFSTIFGVYYFAGCVLGGYSTLALVLMWLQGKGCLVNSVNREHYHDIGKMMFAFIIFWSYIAFSQFMLIWYGDIPEETHWFKWRFTGDWRVVSGMLLFCHFVIPFLGMLSRHIKRNRKTLAFWAVWLLVIHYVDVYWTVMPSIEGYHDTIPLSLMDVLNVVGVVALFLGVSARRATGINLVPTRDPRLADSLSFENA